MLRQLNKNKSATAIFLRRISHYRMSCCSRASKKIQYIVISLSRNRHNLLNQFNWLGMIKCASQAELTERRGSLFVDYASFIPYRFWLCRTLSGFFINIPFAIPFLTSNDNCSATLTVYRSTFSLLQRQHPSFPSLFFGVTSTVNCSVLSRNQIISIIVCLRRRDIKWKIEIWAVMPTKFWVSVAQFP